MPAADRSRWASSRARELDPWREHDACGVGFVARASGHRSADIARLALGALARVAHRGAAATDRSGDGAGLLTQIPAPLFYREAASRGLALAPGQPFAVGSFFLPREHDALGRATAIIEEVLCREGLPVLGWRDVPVDLEVLGAGARASCPTIRQAVIAAPDGGRHIVSSWRPPSGAAMTACRMVGQEARAPAPRTSRSTGTSRHPSTGRPSRHSASSMMAVARPRASCSRGRKKEPTANG